LSSSGQLQGAAQDWWDAYCFAHENPDTITWDQFREAFREHHVPIDLIKLKKEFLALKQGSMTVYEYRDRFTQLSRYCPDEDERDEDKQDHFLEGLNDGLSYMTSNVKYANFLEMVDRALVLESVVRWRRRRGSSIPLSSKVVATIPATTGSPVSPCLSVWQPRVATEVQQ
jgi:hypothetical protein